MCAASAFGVAESRFREASPSMFAYCTEALHLSEAEAYPRIAAARASREHPILLAMLGDGRLHLSAIARLAPHLTVANRDEVLRRATHRSKREIEELVAELSPRPDAAAWIRKLPEPQASRATATLRAAGICAGIGIGARARAGCTVDAGVPGLLARLRAGDSTRSGHSHGGCLAPWGRSGRPRPQRRLRSARGHRSPVPGPLQGAVHGDLAAIVEAAVTEKLQRLEARRFASTPKPRKTLAVSDTTASSSRQIPAAVKRVVRERDGNRCRFVDAQGRRCTQRDGLEFHHRHPHGLGGDRSPDNLSLLCRSHNAYLADVDYASRVRARDSALVALEGRQVDEVLWAAGRPLVPGEIRATQKREAVILDHERLPT